MPLVAQLPICLLVITGHLFHCMLKRHNIKKSNLSSKAIYNLLTQTDTDGKKFSFSNKKQSTWEQIQFQELKMMVFNIKLNEQIMHTEFNH
jgi:hypothetical protein